MPLYRGKYDGGNYPRIFYYISFKTEMQQKEQNKIAVWEKFFSHNGGKEEIYAKENRFGI